jgi:2-polyprenyl-6-methoxyphenol hydroxylase-like FAD-dependent oxidoreductase
MKGRRFMTNTRTALVIGGGIAGPVAAMALQQAGIQATVYEAYASTAEGAGGGLTIAPNGLNALDVIGAADAVRCIGVPMTAMVIESWTGKRLAEFGSLPGLPVSQFVWRAELHKALHDEAAGRGIRTEHGKRLTSVTAGADAVTAHFADGTQASADILIGADGIRSTVRSLIDPAAPRPRYAGLLSFAARMDDTGLAATGGKMHMIFGKRAFFGYQVFDDGSGGWFVNLPHEAPMTLAETRAVTAGDWLSTLRSAFAADRTPAPGLLDRTGPGALLIIGPMEDIPSVPVWSSDRMVLIGDAAHASSPSSGQGASLAAESAIQLARCLRDLPHQQAFTAYEHLRRARAEKIIKMAARTNQNKAAGPLARVVRDLVLPAVMKVLAKPERMAWQVGYRIDWAAPAQESLAQSGNARA